ncbi:MAG: hypothetical protein DVB25_04565 [Verrucomicrobia bacterium]|nr:MAG: hypothetical protein DVB25_04565 [Verrucomicrobiota bacterium]
MNSQAESRVIRGSSNLESRQTSDFGLHPRAWWRHAARVAGVALGLWGLLTAMTHSVRIVPGWSPAAVACGLTAAAELLIFLYRYEAATLGSRRTRQLLGLRLAALGLLAWILIEPTYVRSVKRRLTRQVAVLWDDSASMDLIDDGTVRSRAVIARDALTKSGLLKKLGDHVKLQEIHFARSPENDAGATATGWNQATDIAAALDSVLEQIPPDELAGALLVSDGRHNRPSRVEDSARRFGTLDAPLGIVAVGSPEAPRDAAVLALRSPDAIHLGDRMRVSADLKFDGYKGQQAKVQLIGDGKLLEERQIAIPQDHYREEVKFVHLPAKGGTGGYHIQIQPLPGDRFPENNRWSFETSITEARTNVLLVDDYPRWEFRYLRNLFYGRDKSVHLQWLLLHPELADGQAQPNIAASAGRPFGQAAANQFPQTEAEWRKFDVIILGDLPPAAISDATWAIISRCVNERGALLIFSAGPNYMPHALDSKAARDLLPVDPGWNHHTFFGDTAPRFRLSLTAEGRHSPVTSHAIGSLANEQVWAAFPALQWRHPISSVKDGAEILLTATDELPPTTTTAIPDAATGLGAALDDLASRRQNEAKRALLVTRQTGHGKVAVVLTDRIWRLREGAGDVHHHQFWGNLVRWGAGPLLRAGSDTVALGTDQLTYTADDPILITARLRDANLGPLVDGSLRAEILRGDTVVATVPLVAVAGSNGLHEGKAAPIHVSGLHTLRLVGRKAAELLSAEGKKSLTTSFRVIGARGPIELAETTLDRPLLDEAAKASGGKVVGPEEVASLLPLFLTEGAKREEIRETSLWDNLLVFATLACVLTAEWWLRRKAGLP